MEKGSLASAIITLGGLGGLALVSVTVINIQNNQFNFSLNVDSKTPARPPITQPRLPQSQPKASLPPRTDLTVSTIGPNFPNSSEPYRFAAAKRVEGFGPHCGMMPAGNVSCCDDPSMRPGTWYWGPYAPNEAPMNVSVTYLMTCRS